MFPKLEGELGPHMTFRGKKVLNWSLNNYLGLANHPEVRKTDAEAAAKWGLAYPMGSRMMTGHTSLHEKFEKELAEFERKEDAFLFNFGYQGIISTIDALMDRHDVIVYDSEAHACLIDGARLHMGKRMTYRHNDIESCEATLKRATKLCEETGGGILLITEGVYGMTGALGNLDEIVALKKKYKFRILIDDAHGFGNMGPTGRGTSEHFGVMDDVDLYIGAYAKSMASIGGFVAGPKVIIDYTLQDGFRRLGFDIGPAQACVTPVAIKGGVGQATRMAVDLRENYGIFCSIVVYPVIPKGMVIFRIISTAAHSMEDVEYTLKAFTEMRDKLNRGEYDGDDVIDMADKG